MFKRLKKVAKIGDKYKRNLFKDKRIMTVASSWVFFFLLALLPIVFLMVTAFTVFNPSFCNDLIYYLPSEFRPAGEMLLSTAQRASGGVTILFFLSMVFSGSTLFNQMSKDGEYLYGVRLNNEKGISRRILSIFALASLFVLFIGLALVVTFWEKVISALPVIQNRQLFVKILSIFIAILVCYGIIMLLNVFICPVKQPFKCVALGSLVSLSIIVIGTLGFIVYLRVFSFINAFYGSLLGILVFLIWAYILMTGLVTGSAVSVYELKKYPNKTDGQTDKRKAVYNKRRRVNA